MAAAGSAALAWTGIGEAQPLAGVDVRWVAPARCPGPDDVQARVGRLLGSHAPRASRQGRLVAEATVVAMVGRYRLTLTVRQGDEPSSVTRVFDSASCESLAGAAAVTIALLARGEERTAPPAAAPPAAAPPATTPPETTPPETTSPATTPPETTPPAMTPPDAAPRAPTPPAAAPADVGANPEASESAPSKTTARPSTRGSSVTFEAPLLAIDAGVLPSFAYGAGAGVGARVNRFRVRLAGFLWLSQSGTHATPYEATYHRRTGQLSGCYAWPGGSFEVGPCLAMTLEDVSAGGSGPDIVAGSGHVRWLTVGVAARAGWSMRKWATLFLRPGVTFTTSRPTFSIDGVGPLYQVPLVAGGAEVGCEWIF